MTLTKVQDEMLETPPGGGGGGGTGITDGDKGDITVSGSGTTWTIDARAVTFGKLAAVGTGVLLGRNTAGSGDAEQLTPATARTILNVEDGATADQSNAEIETAYNSQVDVIAQVEAEAGTATTVRRWTAQRVAQAIDALAPASSGGGALTVVQSADSAITIVRATHITAAGGSIGYLEATNASPTITLEAMQAGDRLVVRFTNASLSGGAFALGSGWSCNPTPPTGLTAQYDEYTFTCTEANVLEMSPGVTEDIPLADLADINHTRLLGRKTASGDGPPEELSPSEARALLGVTNNAFQTVDLTSAAHSAAWGTRLLLIAGTNDVNLPAAVNNGEWLEVINRTGGEITINRNGTDTIDGATSYALADNAGVSLIDLSDGTNDIIATPAAA